MFGGYHQITEQSQLRATTQAMPPHSSHQNFARGHHDTKYRVEFCEHFLDFVGSMGSNINARRERLLRSGEDNYRNTCLALHFPEGARELLHERNIDNVQRRMIELDARDRRSNVEQNSLCGGSGHVRKDTERAGTLPALRS